MKQKKYPQHVIDKRRDIVKKLYFGERVPLREIALAFKKDGQDWHENTIRRDVKFLKEEMQETVGERTILELVRRRIFAHDRVIRKQWDAYKEEIDFQGQSRILQRIDNSESLIIKDLQELGLVLKPEVEASNAVADAIHEGYKRALEREKAIKREMELKGIVLDNVEKKERDNDNSSGNKS